MALDKSGGDTRTADQPATRQRQAREGEGASSRPILSPPVEAVLRFGFDQEFVIAIYQRLKTQSSVTGNGNNGSSAAVDHNGCRRITAAVLMVAVDDAKRNIRVSSADVGDREGNGFYPEDGPCRDGDVTNNEDSSAQRNSGDRSDVTAMSYGPSEPSGLQATTDPESVEPNSMDQSPEVLHDVTSNSATNSTTAMLREINSNQIGDGSEVAVERQSRSLPSYSESGRQATATRDRSSSTPRETTQRHLERLRALRAENRRLKARNTCLRCRERPVSLTLLPCGHFCFCQECGSTFSACPVCRKTILADVRTFVA